MGNEETKGDVIGDRNGNVGNEKTKCDVIGDWNGNVGNEEITGGVLHVIGMLKWAMKRQKVMCCM